MSELIVIGFDEEKTAFDMQKALKDLQKQGVLKMEDIVVVTKDEDGEMKLHQSLLTKAGAMLGGFWGAMIGLIFLNPLVGGAVGAGLGALKGHVFDAGVEHNFIKDVKNLIESKNASLFIRLKEVTNEERVIEAISPFKGEVLKSNLLADDEAKLKEVLGDA
jgi:uncharacterized membrane protein